ncbi:hypothetical protein OO013_19995 [Mangrovivirga sp. M17]|uniref:Lipoprotein n=1 Tax=Mangrovivirga halotolerans TaxID=2993936 RepID=A0ABT3RWM1_9BACT|nr:hypothetical protein [Mangrovivirga halotolerans]MCX2746171.1 hypothetical protein [Mangrovivirga halotolerans]
MKKLIIVLFIGWLTQGCNNERTNKQEKEVSIYKKEREFVYSVAHFDIQDNLYLLDTLILTTSPKVYSKKYGQTKSSWNSSGKNMWRSYSGITENDTVVWIHPPRTNIYRKLELAPFPMIKYPLEVGNEWTWKLLIGSHYSFPGHAEWKKGINESFVSNYLINEEKVLSSNFGKLNCYKITSICSNKFKQTELIALYNRDYGFVKLQYNTIDDEKMIMELVSSRELPSTFVLPFTEFTRN